MSLLRLERTWSASWNDKVAASGNALPTSCDTTLTHIHITHTKVLNRWVNQGSRSLTDKKIQDFSRTPMKNFPGPFQSPWMFKYKEKMAFTYNIQSVVHCRKFSMKQNVDNLGAIHFAAYFPFKPLEKCMTFKDIFSRTLSFNFQDFPGPKRFSRIFQVLEFSRNKIMFK